MDEPNESGTPDRPAGNAETGAGILTPLKRALLAIEKLQAQNDALQGELEGRRRAPIAIIGLGCRFPGAADPEAFWTLLRDGVDAVREVPSDRWDAAAYLDPTPGTSGKMVTRWGGFLDAVDQFDPGFFGISPREAARMDPQQRLLLEVSWEALEHAGLAPERLARSRTGVFIGISHNDYTLLQSDDPALIDAYAGTGNAFSIAANRLSYVYDFRGPSIALDTACSSSLVTAHLAVQSLRNGECDLALAGGVNLILSPELSVAFSQARMLSPEGRCKTFDASADGYVRGEGCGIVVLKRLADAQRDGDTVLAVIYGSAVNQDGRSNGLTAPSTQAQQAVIREALRDAGLRAEDISYVEAHGTGTVLGDTIEMDALAAALGERTPATPCLVGSVKTNIGHLEAASGVAGLIKAVLMLQKRQIAPHLHLQEVNPHLRLAERSLAIPVTLQPWQAATTRYAGVHAFGFGGANAHLILGEAPVCEPAAASPAAQRAHHILALAALNPAALHALVGRLAGYLAAHPEADVADICASFNTGRSHFPQQRTAARAALIAATTAELATRLRELQAEPVTVRLAAPRVAFLFTGQGAAHQGMGRQLYHGFPRFREAIERCDALLRDRLPRPLLSVLYTAGDAAHILHEPQYAWPALFAVEYALAQLWQSWGIAPAHLLGQGVGEYVAATIAGALTLEDALQLVAEIGRLLAALPQKAALAAFERFAARYTWRTPAIPILSGVTGGLLAGGELLTASYLERTLRQPALERAMQVLHTARCNVFLELGPRPQLSEVVRQTLDPAEALYLCALQGNAPDERSLLTSLAAYYAAGGTVDWPAFHRDMAYRRLALPAYPFQRQRYWSESAAAARRRGQPAPRVDQPAEAVPPSAGEPNAPALTTRADVLAAPAAARPGLILGAVREHLARVLGAPAAELSAESRLNYLGLDSILALELKSALEVSLHVELPIVKLLEGPSLGELAEVVAGLVSDAGETAIPLAIEEADTEAEARDYPLSIGQRALWLQHQVAPGSVYNPVYAVRIKSAVDIEALQHALQTLTDRHPALRTTFGAQDGQPFQRVHAHRPAHCAVIDATGWDEPALEQRLIEEAYRPFDLEVGPLLRVNLFTRGVNADPVLLLAAHHISVDMWSLAVLMSELGTAYAEALGETMPRTGTATDALPAPRYTDFVRWQQAMLAGPSGERSWRYWQAQLAGELPDTDLPIDRPRPAVQTYLGSVETLDLGPELSARLRQFCEQTGATPYVVMLAAFQTLLHRYMQANDIIVGSPTTGRARAQFASIIGYFVSPVALRIGFADNPTVTDLIRRVRQTVLDALAHADFPLPLLVERLRPPRDPGRTPIFQTMFVYERPQLLYEEGLARMALGADGTQMDLGSLSLESVAVPRRMSPFDLTLLVADAGACLSVAAEYNMDLFDPATVRRMLGHYRTLLAGMLAAPQLPVAALPVLTDVERNTIFESWSGTCCADLAHETIHAAFEAQARRTPDAAALVASNVTFTYRELNERADWLAQHLRGLGIGPERLVALSFERSPEMIVAILGVLKAGGAYVPLDPAIPGGRLATILDDARPALLLTQERLAEDLRLQVAGQGVPVGSLRADGALTGPSRPEPHAATCDLPPATGDNLAYAIYTSGSTGVPKGVMLQHRGLVNLVQAQVTLFDVTPADRVYQFASYTFDASVSEIFIALTSGAALHLARAETVLSPELLTRALQAGHITNITLPPTVLRLLDPAALPKLRTVISAGEACTPDVVAAWAPGRRFINAYGPSEVTIGPTGHVVNDGNPTVPVLTANAPIGRPIANITAYILDRRLQPVPAGVPGELYLGGIGLARGYLHRPDLTAEKFVPNPFLLVAGDRLKVEGNIADPGQPSNLRELQLAQPANFQPATRLYRTGDRARFLPDGAIEFLGRVDHQVKIRGFRVELGEVEAALSHCPGVREAVVVARDLREPDAATTGARSDDLRLVAYYVAQEGAGPSEGDLRARLREQLPEYMTPSAFVRLEALPLNASGKVDRRALPRPLTTRSAADVILPQSQLERDLARIWQQLLGVDQISIHDNFFDLGGHSLLMAQAHSRLQQLLGREVPIVDLFHYPTISRLAKHLGQAPGTAQPPAGATAEVAPREGEDGPRPAGAAQPAGMASAGARAQQQRDAVAQQRERMRAAQQARQGGAGRPGGADRQPQ